MPVCLANKTFNKLKQNSSLRVFQPLGVCIRSKKTMLWILVNYKTVGQKNKFKYSERAGDSKGQKHSCVAGYLQEALIHSSAAAFINV